MTTNRNKLYLFLLIACFIGYIWLFFLTTGSLTENQSAEVCLIKHVTSIPCPSCGSTRSVISLTEGNFMVALKSNPMGYIVAFIMLVVPVWILMDIIFGKKSLLDCYQKTEKRIRNPKLAIPLIVLVVINWLWNITKVL